MIRRESLIVDRLLQATDGSKITFQEAVRLCAVVYSSTNWSWVEGEIERRDSLEPGLQLGSTLARGWKRCAPTSNSAPLAVELGRL